MTDERKFQFSSGSSILYLSSANELTFFFAFLHNNEITGIRCIAITHWENKKFPFLKGIKQLGKQFK